MIEVRLTDKTGATLLVESHPEFLDFVLRDSFKRSSEAVVLVANDNLVAPILASINGKTARETFGTIQKSSIDVASKYARREDGARVLALLADWLRQWPQGRWNVAGAGAIAAARFIETPTEPRYSSRSLSIDPYRARIVFIGDAEPMDDCEGIDFEPLERAELSGHELLERENRIAASGGGSNGRSRKKPPKAGNGYRVADLGEGPREATTSVVSIRVPTPEKEALDSDGEAKRDTVRALAHAMQRGAKAATIVATLDALKGETL